MVLMGCLVLATACMLAGTSCVPFHGKVSTKGRKSILPLLWRHLLIATLGYGMPALDMRDHSMTLTYGTRVHGSFTRNVNFEFEVDGIVFHKLWLLVDGIYSELECFGETLGEAVAHTSERYAAC
jgi:hypothetical protein